MSLELMHSLDRNFVFGDKKQGGNHPHANRSFSFNVPASPPSNWWRKSPQREQHYHIIPRVNQRLDDEQNSVDEPTPDYDEEIAIHRTHSASTDEVGEEPVADYDDSQASPTPEQENASATPPMVMDLGVTNSFVIPQMSITPSSETCTLEDSPLPPTPPPLPNALFEQRNTTFRCRTIADEISVDHKLSLKDEVQAITTEEKPPGASHPRRNPPKSQADLAKKSPAAAVVTTKPRYLHLSQEILQKTTLRKVSQPVSRSYSIYGSMSHINEHDTDSITLRGQSVTTDDQALDGLSSSATTSITIDNEYEHRSSSKIYNDYKRRASSINVCTTKTFNHGPHSHSSSIHPIHTQIGLRSSTSSSSTIDKPADLPLSNKQMNVGVINQLNEHLSTRFRKQQQEICARNSADSIAEDITDRRSYDHPPDELSSHTQTNLYDEPQHTEITQLTSIICSEKSTGSIPPPPPP